MSDTVTVTLIGPAKVNGKRHAPGAKLEVSAEVAKHLIEADAIAAPRDWSAGPTTESAALADALQGLTAATNTEGAEDLPKAEAERDEAPSAEPPAADAAAPAGEAEASPATEPAEGAPQSAPSGDGPVRKTGRSKTKG